MSKPASAAPKPAAPPAPKLGPVAAPVNFMPSNLVLPAAAPHPVNPAAPLGAKIPHLVK